MVKTCIKRKRKKEEFKIKIKYFTTNVFLSIATKPKPTGKVFRHIQICTLLNLNHFSPFISISTASKIYSHHYTDIMHNSPKTTYG